MVHPLDAVFAKFITDFLTMFVTGVVLFSGIILHYGLPVSIDLVRVFGGFVMMGLLGLGFGSLNCVIQGFWPTWRHVWSVLTKPLFIMSGIFYTFETLPVQAQAVLWYNPLFHVIGIIRSGLFSGYHPAYVSPLYVLGLSATLFLVGAFLARRHRIRLIER